MIIVRRLRAVFVALILSLTLFALWQMWPGTLETAHPKFAGNGSFTQHDFQGASYLLYVPRTLPAGRHATVLVALHGMGADPQGFAEGLVAAAEGNGWVMVVPHLPYGDWTQSDKLKSEEKKMMAWLDALLGALPDESGLSVNDHALLYGFSRGGQLAHRFALAYPQRVISAAIMSPGTYTLPVEHSATSDKTPLNFPVGVNDIDAVCGRSFDPAAVTHIPFWVGVGEKDNVPGDVPRQWDVYLGRTRVDRARAFAGSLRAMGASVELTVFPGLGHAESLDSRARAMTFLSSHDDPKELAEDWAALMERDVHP